VLQQEEEDDEEGGVNGSCEFPSTDRFCSFGQFWRILASLDNLTEEESYPFC